ncbi:ABC transporter permease [Pyrococcus furiosus DSM 3638]|uniref:Dipeptide transport system permease protein n=3 Tax=Pyrococcus furiosus TaxID=2261 RepID=Q8U120_PYRFU|nr:MULTISPECIES: ABC transporter permease [Pyrococcus]AAL81533.1 dipeptide transport system permease protein [Pyrococcus furiosus DSM 3638]AFN04190.1 dipeptide transport system permease [Pyrococcus furiosus COM1]MDK2868867.1 peptide/nickel transport system permease protein [Pyrococcus sp.]QEK79041.1 ABC transporter permease [Pyrococcus furiosus DSM 3638]
MANLKKFLIRRLLTFIPTIIGVTIIVFLIAYKIPADPAKAWAGGEKATQAAIERIIREYHLDKPWYDQYIFLMKGLLTNTIIDPRTSNPVMYDVGKRFPVTFQLAIIAFVFILLVGIPLGIISALKRNTWIDTVVRIFALLGVSTPAFWLGYLMLYVFFVKYRITTIAGVPPFPPKITGVPMIDALLRGDFALFKQHLARFWLPGFTLGFLGMGVTARFVRNSFLEALSSDFVQFLKAKGVPKLRLYRHALKNALVPIVTVLGLQFGGLLGGTPITETVFGLPGMGSYAVQSIQNLDFPVVVAITFIYAIIYVVTNLVVDILYAIIDPRVRY